MLLCRNASFLVIGYFECLDYYELHYLNNLTINKQFRQSILRKLSVHDLN